jgi:hypothetical protein
MIEQYRILSSKDQTAFKRWLAINTVVGACLFTLVAIVSIFYGGESSSETARKGGAIQHAEAK